MDQKSLVLQIRNLLCMIIKSIIMGLHEEVKESNEYHWEQKSDTKTGIQYYQILHAYT